jgi:hypothetical protein
MKQKATAPVLPVPTEQQMRGVSHQSSFQLYQFIRYLLHTKNGERGDIISATCKIRNPSDIACKYKDKINSMGLLLECKLIKNIVKIEGVERIGVIGTWHLSIIDDGKWTQFGSRYAKAANDEVIG